MDPATSDQMDPDQQNQLEPPLDSGAGGSTKKKAPRKKRVGACAECVRLKLKVLAVLDR